MDLQERSQRYVPVANNEEPLLGHIKAKGAPHISLPDTRGLSLKMWTLNGCVLSAQIESRSVIGIVGAGYP